MQVAKLFCVFVVISFSVCAQATQTFDVDSPHWSFGNDQATVSEIAGRKAIKITSGLAQLEGVMLENGRIEFDMYLPKERAFAYLLFRGQSKQEVEAIYLRSHKSKAPDAIQYAPIFQRRSAWQLYHGESGTGAAVFPSNQWFPVKVELLGQRMKVWVADMPDPVLDVKRLGHEPVAGWLAFRGFVPRTSDAKFSAYFSNLRVTKSTAPVKAEEQPVPLPTGQITRWRVSPAFDSKAGPINTIPETLRQTVWTTPEMRYNGVFEFLRSRPLPEGSRHWSVVAEVTLNAEQAQTCAVHFGFSDEITLSVNEQPILYQDASYRFADNRQQGVLHPDQLVAFVPLKAGDNLLRAVISDKFGGWGLSARMENCQHVSVR